MSAAAPGRVGLAAQTGHKGGQPLVQHQQKKHHSRHGREHTRVRVVPLMV